MMNFVLLFLMVTTGTTFALKQADLDYIGQSMEIRIKVDENTKYDGKKHRFSLNMKNTGSKTIKRDDWSIYFYSFWMIEPGNLPSADGYILANYKVKFTRINGGLFSMTPTADFPDILPNGIHFIEFYGQGWAVSRSDVPPNWYVAGQNLKPVNIKSTATGKQFVTEFSSMSQWKRYLMDQYNPFTAQDRYRRHDVRNFNTHNRIIPTPKKMEIQSSKYLSINDKSAICTPDVSESCTLLKEKLGIAVSENENTETDKQKKTIRIWTNSAIGENMGLYHLYTDMDEETITLIGRSPTAVHYGIQSLLSLVAGSPDHKSIPDVTVEDEPRFEHRGMHVDVSRNFRTKADIIRLMDGMSMYKLNKLHIHLTDDEGWRLAIPDIPELTEVGGKRCHDLDERTCIIPQLGSGADSSTSGSGYFTVNDFQDILREATKRHIDVIPGIGMPVHSNAAIKAMEARYSQYKDTDPTHLWSIDVQKNKPSSNYIEIFTAFNINVLNSNFTHEEAYWIDITQSSISISVKSTSGAYHAYQSLRSLGSGGKLLPVGVIKDQPRFQYRGLQVDVGRNFHTKEEILKIIDAMAMYKLNKFHFHLTDDEGWRLEIPGLPELTEVGSKRCHDLKEDECILSQLGSGSAKDGFGSGFYTVEDYKEILRYANDRHIEVIPEFDMPGHCLAGVKAMEARFRKYLKYGDEAAAKEYLMTDFDDTTQYLSVQMFTDNTINICIDSTVAFIRYVIQSVKAMHKDIQPLQTYHFGGDEMTGAWKDSPECRKLLASSGLKDVSELKKYFAHLMSRITDEEDLHLATWGDALKEGPTVYDPSQFPGKKKITAYNWDNVWEFGQGDRAYKLANAGYKVVLGHATHLYFDHPQEPDPEERGSYWATRFTDTRKTFGFVPSNIYHNAEKAGNGKPLTHDQICTNNGFCLRLEKPENIIGMQGQVRTETIRTEDQLHEMVFPRLLALAERAWHKSQWEDIANDEERIKQTNEEWTSFAKSLVQKELTRLESLGIKYRVPVPGARLSRGKLFVNTALPGLRVQYSVDNKQTWEDVSSQKKIQLFLRAESVDTTRHSRVVSMTIEISCVK